MSWHRTDLGFTSRWPCRFGQLGLSHRSSSLKRGRSLLPHRVCRGFNKSVTISQPTQQLLDKHGFLLGKREGTRIGNSAGITTAQRGSGELMARTVSCGSAGTVSHGGWSTTPGTSMSGTPCLRPALSLVPPCDHRQIPSPHQASLAHL